MHVPQLRWHRLDPHRWILPLVLAPAVALGAGETSTRRRIDFDADRVDGSLERPSAERISAAIRTRWPSLVRAPDLAAQQQARAQRDAAARLGGVDAVR